MGFTRYWVRPAELEAERFSAFSKACQEACQEYRDSIFDPRFTDDEVAFDGWPDCEPFVIERISGNAWRENRRRENGIFEYCKTQRLPYDAAVARCLELLKEHFPEVEVPEAL